ncbi:acyl-CoA dehydrogenase family protein [Roseibacterium beibuensis]|uniref:Acyl-CoA dehydrogenase family protein n=1 Tax=[Roseibacterium] beibuensis TaxID=1193142 RepID=A0ABP9LMG2_9RHOB|nr:acyl-CoA dehydrogenase family protein [Roseibacterium beibuensis]MCS6625841.1 acyl-CoA dehydrogenase family protein [Roseibacterium beibuensis]
MGPRTDLTGHDVTNQPPARGDRDLWADDPVLRDHMGEEATPAAHGAALGRGEVAEWGRRANRHLPELVQFDAGGRRLDEVRFSESYHHLMSLGLTAGYAGGPWTGGSHLAHAAMVYLHSQVEPGTCCPMTMTYAAVPALAEGAPGLACDWVPKLTAAAYDPSVAPLSRKRAATLGMAMTEKQGGSDVRANATRAAPADGAYRLTGHKWFCSAPMSDGFLMLAQAPGGLSCFLVPRWLEDGTRNPIHLMRLKDKLGNRANASAEIELHGAWAQLVGEEGRGVPAIIRMVHHTRLDTAMAPAGLMRAALDHLHHWVSHRSAFQRRLIDQPLMRSLLADLVLDWEGATALGLHVARAFDDPARAGFARIGVALAKFLNNKLAIRVIAEAMEGLGGMGYVEDTPLPMLYREAPLNGIWEGSGNVICLDILRTLARDAGAGAALRAELKAATGADARYDAALSAHAARWPGLPEEGEARVFAERLALLLTAAVLIRHAPHPVADAFVASRLDHSRGHVAGSLPGIDPVPLIARLGGGD